LSSEDGYPSATTARHGAGGRHAKVTHYVLLATRDPEIPSFKALIHGGPLVTRALFRDGAAYREWLRPIIEELA
jgi:hypothetical protein